MIVRPHPNHLLLITQPDHAALAAGVMGAWQRPLPDAPVRDVVLLATREHDNGWHEADAAPLVDATTGRILDFMNAPESVRQSIWPRAVERLSSTPYAAALVAQHALSVFNHYRKLPAWRPFFERMESARHDALRRAAPHTIEDLARDYFFVRMGDLASLTFCNAWNDLQRLDGFELRLEGPRLTIRPDPFDRREVPLSISARQLPDRRYTSEADACEAFRSAPTVIVNGVALGAR